MCAPSRLREHPLQYLSSTRLFHDSQTHLSNDALLQQTACPTQLLQHLTLSSPANYESLSSPACNDKTTFSAHPQDKSCTLDHTNKHDVTCTQHVNTLQFFSGQSAPTAFFHKPQQCAYQKFAIRLRTAPQHPFRCSPTLFNNACILHPILVYILSISSTQLQDKLEIHPIGTHTHPPLREFSWVRNMHDLATAFHPHCKLRVFR